MSAENSKLDAYQTAWDSFVIDVRAFADDAYAYISTMSDQEKIAGLSVFIIVLVVMIFSSSVKKNSNPGSGRQFTGALFLVVIFAFGAGWSVDTSAGSLSHFFMR